MLRDLFSLFPAYAGVILNDFVQNNFFCSFPRIRGGDPAEPVTLPMTGALFPAYAGVIPNFQQFNKFSTTFPRIRGGDPTNDERRTFYAFFSPHTRG